MDDDICAHMSDEMVKLIIGKEWHASLQLKMSKLLKEDENLIIFYFCEVGLILGLIVNTANLLSLCGFCSELICVHATQVLYFSLKEISILSLKSVQLNIYRAQSCHCNNPFCYRCGING